MRTKTAAISISLLMSTALAGPAAAFDFSWDDVKASFDSTYTVGGAMRTSSRDPRLVGLANGGQAFSLNNDDGNLNFDKGDFTSLAVRGINELSLEKGNVSFFGRLNYFYDYINHDKTLARTQLSDKAKFRAGLRLNVLDLYVSGKFDAGSVPMSVRFGNQVLNWGESTFLQNGINVINPADVTKLRSAGSELREGLLPVPMIQTTASLSDNFSVEAFYQFDWKRTEIEPAGTFFSTTDIGSPGARYVYLGFGLPTGPRDNPMTNAGFPVGSVVERSPDHNARDTGQFGFAARYLLEALNDTELGAYFVRYNSRLPLVSARTGTLAGLVGGNYGGSANYYREYPNGIKMAGGSLSTALGDSGIALQGEYAYHWDQPIQVEDVELLFAALSPLDTLLGFPAAIQPVFRRNQLGPQGFNQDIPGYRRKAYSTAQFTVTEAIPTLGPVDQLILLAEVGGMWVHNMEDKSVLRYEGPNTVTNANPFYTAIARQPATEAMTGFADPFSWGYRLAVRGEINNAMGTSIQLLPTIAFNHDVNGTSPTPISNYVEHKKALSLGVGANYLNKWLVNVGYTTNWGGGKYNVLRDRDFVQLTVSYAY